MTLERCSYVPVLSKRLGAEGQKQREGTDAILPQAHAQIPYLTLFFPNVPPLRKCRPGRLAPLGMPLNGGIHHRTRSRKKFQVTYILINRLKRAAISLLEIHRLTCPKADKRPFNAITDNSTHVLSKYLPNLKIMGHNLRPRGHRYELPQKDNLNLCPEYCIVLPS